MAFQAGVVAAARGRNGDFSLVVSKEWASRAGRASPAPRADGVAAAGCDTACARLVEIFTSGEGLGGGNSSTIGNVWVYCCLHFGTFAGSSRNRNIVIGENDCGTAAQEDRKARAPETLQRASEGQGPRGNPQEVILL